MRWDIPGTAADSKDAVSFGASAITTANPLDTVITLVQGSCQSDEADVLVEVPVDVARYGRVSPQTCSARRDHSPVKEPRP